MLHSHVFSYKLKKLFYSSNIFFLFGHQISLSCVFRTWQHHIFETSFCFWGHMTDWPGRSRPGQSGAVRPCFTVGSGQRPYGDHLGHRGDARTQEVELILPQVTSRLQLCRSCAGGTNIDLLIRKCSCCFWLLDQPVPKCLCGYTVQCVRVYICICVYSIYVFYTKCVYFNQLQYSAQF